MLHRMAPMGNNKPANAGKVEIKGETKVATPAARMENVPTQPTNIANFPRFTFRRLPAPPFCNAIGQMSPPWRNKKSFSSLVNWS